jgi:hypothetical protein
MPKVLITYAEAVAAKARLIEIQDMTAQEQKGMAVAQHAAEALIRFFQTQERYALEPKTPADFNRAQRFGRNPENSAAARLEALTDDQILDLQAKMTADYPGKPS